MKMKILPFLLFSFILSPSYTVSAAEPGDASVTLGMIKITDDAVNVLAGTGVTIDDSDNVNIVTGAFYVSPNLAFEAGLISGAEVSASLSANDSGTYKGNTYSLSGTATVKAESDPSYLLGVKYSSPGPISFYGKTGMLFWNVNYTASASGTFTYAGSNYTLSTSTTFHSADGSDPYIGLGMSYAIGKDNSINFDYISSEVDTADISGYGFSWVRKL